MRTLADNVKIPGREDAKAGIFRLIYDWLCDAKNGEWVIVLDSVDDAESLFEHLDRNAIKGNEAREGMTTRRRIDFLEGGLAFDETAIVSESELIWTIAMSNDQVLVSLSC